MLWDEAEVIALRQRHGFAVVQPEHHRLREAALFRAAESVVGVKGAALTNIMFCSDAASLLVLSPAGWVDPFLWDCRPTEPGLRRDVWPGGRNNRASGDQPVPHRSGSAGGAPRRDMAPTAGSCRGEAG